MNPKRKSPKTTQKKAKKVVTHWIDFASKEEKDIIHEEVNMYGTGDEAWESLIGRANVNIFVYKKGNEWSVHVLDREGKDRFKSLMGNPGLKYFGLYLGMLKKDQFNLSLEGVSELVKSQACTRNWVKLTDEGEKSFLYGQGIEKSHLDSLDPKGITHDRGACVILNTQGECLGIGMTTVNDPNLKSVPEGIIIRNIVDRGLYLRRGL